MDAKFIECCFNAQHSVCGFKLKPYSLSHLLVLDGRKNPLVTNEGRISIEHIVDALAVCSRVQFPFRRNALGLHAQFVRGLLRRNPATALRTLKAFRDYQDDFISVPEFWDDPDDTAEVDRLSGPYVLQSACSVMLTFPQLTEERVWTMPLGLLMWYAGQGAELKGSGSRFWDSDGEDEIEEGLRRAEAEITPAMREMAAAIAKRHATAGRN